MKAGWWDALLAFQDLTKAISITRSKISYSLIELQHFFVHQSAAMNSMLLQSTHTPHSQRLQSDPFGIQSEVCDEACLQK